MLKICIFYVFYPEANAVDKTLTHHPETHTRMFSLCGLEEQKSVSNPMQ